MTVRDFSTRPVLRSGLLDRVLLALAAVGLALVAGTTLLTRQTLAETRKALDDRRRDPAMRRTPARGDSQRVLASQALATSEAPPGRILAELDSLMPADVRLNGATLIYGEGVMVELVVVARETAAYDRFLQRLASSRRFSDILPGAESRAGAVTAPIRMRYRVGAT
jgi:hypothetical protein